ncbi:hypothetical protein [Candidatus Magnetominusculus dajiuhuensis]|uniref:hypothetical protein n=1 Tax=Candidatus Magnetominusculus dajiuhuensis TaxID=3137712 RepID=UPI003B42DC90
MPILANIDKTADPRLSPDNIVLTGEITELRDKHARFSKELKELAGALALANTQLTEGTDRIRLFNVEMAVHEKEMKEMQGHIFALKKRRAMAGTAGGVEQEFNRQENILRTLGAKQRELNKLLLEVESNTKLYEQTLADKLAVVERLSLTIADMQPRRKALVEEVAVLEGVAKIFIEAEQLSGELDTLTAAVKQHTNELNGLKAFTDECYINGNLTLKCTEELNVLLNNFIKACSHDGNIPQICKNELNVLKAFVAEFEPEATSLDAQVREFEQKIDALEHEMGRENRELTAQKASLIEMVERLEEQDGALSLETAKLQRELDKQTEILKDRKAVNETNRANAPALEKELLACNEKIAEARVNLTKHGESKRKKDLELENFEKALATKLRLESELMYIEEGTAALGEIARSAT